jgi:hypothetical protein
MARAAGAELADDASAPKAIQIIQIEKQPVEVTLERVPLATLHLDPKNPRLRRHIETKALKGTPTTKALAEFIYEDFRYARELFEQIRDNGGIIDPVHITHDDKVVEGNCRVACLIKLAANHPSEAAWKTVPVLRLPKSVTPRQIAVLQGNFHVSTKNKWEAYAKAAHIDHMHSALKMSVEDIAKNLGIRKPVVERVITQYELITKQFLPRTKETDGFRHWSHVDELFKRKDLEEFRESKKNLIEFVELTLTGKIPGGADVRKLGSVVGSTRAMEVLRKAGIKAALSAAARTDPTVDSSAFRQIETATQTLKALAGDDLARLKSDKRAQSMLRALQKALTNAASIAGCDLKV